MGRHGGINILHQKSWHVWRLDNRLTVERDELRHAEEEREKRKADEQASFSAKVARLRRRSLGQSEEQEALAGVGLHRPHEGEGPGSSSSSSAPAAGRAQEQAEAAHGSKTAQSFKYGMVTTSNLKKAEQDLDAILKMGGAKGRSKGYWGSGGLGSGPHINLFEGAERELAQHREDHQKQVSYTQRNNELAEKSKRRPLSEFDEVAADLPWYVRRAGAAAAGVAAAEGPAKAEDSLELLGAPAKTKRKVRHGQELLRVEASPSKAATEPAEVAPLALLGGAAPAASVGHRALREETKAKKVKKEKKEKNASRRDEARRGAELDLLRQERQAREAKERARARGLHAGGGL